MSEFLGQGVVSRRQALLFGVGVASLGVVGCNKEEDTPIPDASGITTIDLSEKKIKSPTQKVIDRVVAASCTVTIPAGRLSASAVNIDGKPQILTAAHGLYSFGDVKNPGKQPSNLTIACTGATLAYAGDLKSKDKSERIAGRYDGQFDTAFVTPFVSLSSGDTLETRYLTPATAVGDSLTMVGYQGGRDPFKGDAPVVLGMLCIGEDKETGNGLLLGGAGVSNRIRGDVDKPAEGSSGGPIIDLDGFVRGTVAGYKKEKDDAMTIEQIRDRYKVEIVGTSVTSFSVMQFEPLSAQVMALAQTPSC